MSNMKPSVSNVCRALLVMLFASGGFVIKAQNSNEVFPVQREDQNSEDDVRSGRRPTVMSFWAKVFPNPFTNVINVGMPLGADEQIVYLQMSGTKTNFSDQWMMEYAPQLQIDASNFPADTYLLRIQGRTGRNYGSFKIVKLSD